MHRVEHAPADGFCVRGGKNYIVEHIDEDQVLRLSHFATDIVANDHIKGQCLGVCGDVHLISQRAAHTLVYARTRKRQGRETEGRVGDDKEGEIEGIDAYRHLTIERFIAEAAVIIGKHQRSRAVIVNGAGDADRAAFAQLCLVYHGRGGRA